MKTRQKILFVDNSWDSFQRDRLELVYAARDIGLEIHIAAPVGADVPKTIRESFSFHEIAMTRKGTSLWVEPATVVAMFLLYRRLRPALVHHFRLKPVLYGSVAASLAGVPAVVNTLTGLGFLFTDESKKTIPLRNWVKKGCRRAFRHRNLRVTFQNPDDRAVFIRERLVRGDQTLIIKGSGVDISLFRPSPEPEGHPIVMLASRMLWDKGIAHFVQAAQDLKAKGVNARFVLVGDSDPGNPTAIPVEQLQAWNETGNIEWWGFRSDMPEVLAKSHIICLPSYREGIPRVLIEAAASGRPIVTTDAPGCRELVLPGENGFLVPVADTVYLAAALRILIENPEMRKRMGIRNRQLAMEEFAQEFVTAQFVDIYRELLETSDTESMVAPADGNAGTIVHGTIAGRTSGNLHPVFGAEELRPSGTPRG